MEEFETIERLWSFWPDGGEVSEEALRVSEDAVAAFPLSSELWCMRGDLLLLTGMYDGVGLDEVEECYRKALELDPFDVENWEGIALFLDVNRGKQDEAEKCFLRAIELGGTAWAFAGYARLLAETGRRAQAIRLLSEGECTFHSDPVVAKMRGEIERGEWD